jgi:hypothetical protein
MAALLARSSARGQFAKCARSLRAVSQRNTVRAGRNPLLASSSAVSARSINTTPNWDEQRAVLHVCMWSGGVRDVVELQSTRCARKRQFAN